MYIADPTTSDEDITSLNEEITKLVEDEGSTIVKTDDMGRRPLAYRIKKFTEGYYFLFEIESSGSEIAELERRMRVNDKIIRYLTVRVDEERKTANKIETKRKVRKEKLASLIAVRDAAREQASADARDDR
jgi:small subunit ribosomal protein S6